MFKVGDYVVGINTTYKRSIYRIIRFNEHGQFDLLFCAFSDRLGKPNEVSYARETDEFRLAETQEVYLDIGFALKVNLNRIVNRLLKIKKSSLVRR